LVITPQELKPPGDIKQMGSEPGFSTSELYRMALNFVTSAAIKMIAVHPPFFGTVTEFVGLWSESPISKERWSTLY
jgi:hypothetical protein